MSTNCIDMSRLRTIAWTALATVAVSSGLRAQTVNVDFEISGAPCGFNFTGPLREQFAALGVHFFGATALDGGAVLNQCGNFGVNAHSGLDFLAFNVGGGMSNGGVPQGPEDILGLQGVVWVAGDMSRPPR